LPKRSSAFEFEVDNNCDYANLIVLADPALQAFRKQRALHPIRALNDAPHPIPRNIAWDSYSENHFQQRVFTQPGSNSDMRSIWFDVRF
jgi:hypothetical protein